MITRIEIDGFKSFVDFAMDVPQLLVLVGANNGGKSNLLDAVDIWRSTMVSGNTHALATGKGGRGPQLFHQDSQGNVAQQMKIAVSWGDEAAFSGSVAISLPQMDCRRTLGSEVLAVDAEPLSAGFEASTWTFLELRPERMRQPAPSQAMPFFDSDGSDFAAVVHDMFERRHESDEYGSFLMDAVSVVPGLAGVQPVFDKQRDEWDVDFEFDSGRKLPSMLVSDGTLRVAGLLAALHFDSAGKTILIGEVEVGLHPALLAELIERVQRRVANNPGLQVIMTTHSPVVVSHVLAENPGSVVFLDQVASAVKHSDWQIAHTDLTRARHVAASGERGTYVSQREVRRYLDTVSIVETV